MEWYIPITIIPGIGLMIQSTSGIMLALNNEITQLETNVARNQDIIIEKLAQLKKLSISIVLLYIGVLLFLFSGIVKALFEDFDTWVNCLLLTGVFSVTFSIFLLLVYSIKAVRIRQKHLERGLKENN